MIKKKYQKNIVEIIKKHIQKNGKIFIFGSSVNKKDFADVDVGIENVEIKPKEMNDMMEDFEESNIPYKIDLVDFSKVDKNFKNKVKEEKIIWLT
jgi:hypothetical protein